VYHYYGNRYKEDEIDTTHSMCGGHEKYVEIGDQKPSQKRQLGTPRFMWTHNVHINLGATGGCKLHQSV
jgi:hypothetical protein